MRSLPSIIPFLLRLTGSLTILCLFVTVLAVVVGSAIRGTTISLILAQPTLSPQGYGSLHLMDIRVGLTKQIVDLPVSCCPVWSPDGTRIAFRGENGQPLFWDMRDGTTHILAQQDFNLSGLSWSPDSQKLVFSVRDAASGKYELYVANIAGGKPERLTFLTESDFYADSYKGDWSPDGRFIVFAARGGRIYRLYRVNADGEKMRHLKTDNPYNFAPAVSPDGQTIDFISGEADATDMFLMDSSGNNIRQLTFSADNEKVPIWSPDGSKILFLTDVNNDSSRVIDIINVDGSGQRRLIDHHTSFDDAPSWSPDGTQILYEVKNAANKGAALYIMDADGSNIRLLLQDSLVFSLESSWQPQP